MTTFLMARRAGAEHRGSFQTTEIVVARNASRPKRGAAPPPKRGKSLNWLLVVVTLALVVTVVIAVKRNRAQTGASTAALPQTPVPPAVMAQLAGVPAATWEQVGLTGATPPVLVSDTASRTPKAVVLYMGAGFCPYCAAARWSLITALARFGTFSGLTYDWSSMSDVYPGTSTFSFHGSTYTSQYVDFQGVELQGNVRFSNGEYAPLEHPTAEQERLITEYDAPPYTRDTGGLPFLLVGGRYMWAGSPFSPQLLAQRSQESVASTLASASDDAARAILANANELTAMICAVDGNQPASVCNTPLIEQAIKALPTKVP
ncbi:MAG TPA: DUF929 family protein [Gemmatimonadales bacterium]|nr:DUF929 family protein [Gemmatimonadales bacterium]